MRVAESWLDRWLSVYLVAVMFVVCAAASFSGIVGKWGLREESARANITRMLAGDAHRPFAHRVLIPKVAHLADRWTPAVLKRHLVDKLSLDRIFTRAKGGSDAAIAFMHLIVGYSVFVALLAAQWVVRLIALDCSIPALQAALAPAMFVLALPYLLTIGGYFYDAWEFLFLALACLLAMRGRLVLLLGMSILACLNKESYLVFVPALYPLLRMTLPRRPALAWTAVLLLVSALVYAAVTREFQGNPGERAEFHLFNNLAAYLNPLSGTYTELELTYGLVGPSGMSLFTLVAVFAVVRRGWRWLPGAVRQHALVSAGLSLPLFLALCATGELRNLSFCFPALSLLLASAMSQPVQADRPVHGQV